MRQRYRDPVLLIAVAPAEDELLFHQELLSLAVTQPGFRYLPLVAADGEQQAVDLTLPMLRPILDRACESPPHAVRNKRIRETVAGSLP